MEMREALQRVKSGALSIEDAEQFFRRAPFEELGYAKLDMHRKRRSGFSEVVFCSGKTDEHLISIFERLLGEYGEVLGTRATAHQYELVKRIFPTARYDPLARILVIEKENKIKRGHIVVCTAGTADIPVAEEAAQTAEFFGAYVERIYDIGVSGLHRLLAHLDTIQLCRCCCGYGGRACQCSWRACAKSCDCGTYISGLWCEFWRRFRLTDDAEFVCQRGCDC